MFIKCREKQENITILSVFTVFHYYRTRRQEKPKNFLTEFASPCISFFFKKNFYKRKLVIIVL